MDAIRIPRLVIAGVASGVGKTTVTIALARALAARGLCVALFKCGPDYLDPTYHARAVGAASQNLDGWMMGKDAVLSTFAQASRGADVALVEGVMGLFDGASPTGEEGSTAQIAKWLRAPVALVVDAAGLARSVAAVAHGFATFDADLRVAAIVANSVGSRGHLDLLRAAQKSPPILGGFPKDAGHAFPERYLGLRTADERVLPDTLLDHWGAQAEEWLAIDALLGVAKDDAFHFYYADNLRRLEALGAELVPFSPIADAALPDVDGLNFGGGYPELFARELASNASMLAAVRSFAERGGPIYAECGGLMYLARGIVAIDGARHAMVGLVPADARMCERLQALGYVEVETQRATILGEAGTRFRGHQFRYSELSPKPEPSSIEHVYSVRKRRGGEISLEGYRVNDVVASYVHAHWASNERVPMHFVRACAHFREERTR